MRGRQQKSTSKPPRRRPSAKHVATATDSVSRYVDLLVQTLDDYCERDHPNWRVETLLWLLELAVQTLRAYIESPKAPHVTWETPWVTWQFPVEWNWVAWKRRDRAGAGFLYEQLTQANTKTRKAASKTIARVMVQYVNNEALQYFTNGAGFEKRGNRYTAILSPETAHLLHNLKGRRAKLQVLEAFFRPFSIGAIPLEFNGTSSRKERKLSKKQTKKLKEACELMDCPSIDLTANIDGNSVKMSLIFQIHPLVVDADSQSAYYPVTVGFVIVPCDISSVDNVSAIPSEPWLNPANWSFEDRKLVWGALLGELKRMREQFARAQDAELVDAVLTVSAKVKVPASASDSELARRAVEKMLTSFQATGEVIELSYQLGEAAPQLSTGARLRYVELLAKLEEATSADHKGRALEELVATLFANVPGFQIKRRARTETEEIDLVVLNAGENPRWKSDAPLILVECKNWSSSCGKNEIVQFKEKLANRRGRSTLGFIVSWNGFAQTVTKELLRGSRESVLIVPITGQQIKEAAQAGTIVPILEIAWDEAVMA